MSDHQWQVHAKVNRVQVDNQLPQCLFPVVMSPVPPPRSVAANSTPKPFMELSVLEYHTSTSRQFKLIHALVQELSIKIDYGLISTLMDMLEEREEVEDLKTDQEDKKLEEDKQLAVQPLKDIATLTVTKGQKNFFDLIHLSPIHLHLSFSGVSYNATGASSSKSVRSNFIELFLKSLGIQHIAGVFKFNISGW